MKTIDEQLEDFRTLHEGIEVERKPSGAVLITIPYELPDGWSHKAVKVRFVAPAGYPAAQPDCFWVEPGGLRLANGTLPQASNDSTPIPEDQMRGTWFSWHVQAWNPSRHTLETFFNVIENRLDPAK